MKTQSKSSKFLMARGGGFMSFIWVGSARTTGTGTNDNFEYGTAD